MAMCTASQKIAIISKKAFRNSPDFFRCSRHGFFLAQGLDVGLGGVPQLNTHNDQPGTLLFGNISRQIDCLPGMTRAVGRS